MSRTALNYLFATLACVAVTATAIPLNAQLDQANSIMLFLLAVVLIALYLGRGPSVWAALLSVACFDFFLVPPIYSFSVDDPRDQVTFVIMLIVALVIGQLTSRLRNQSRVSEQEARRLHALHVMTSKLADATSLDALTAIVSKALRSAITADSAILLPDANGELAVVNTMQSGDRLRIAPLLVKLAYENTPSNDIDAANPVGYFPLSASGKIHGVLVVGSSDSSATSFNEQKEFLETAASLIAIILERVGSPKVFSAIRT